MSLCVWLFTTPWAVAHQAPLSMGFSRQEYWSGLPCPSPRGLPNLGIEPKTPGLAGRFFTTEPPGKSTKQPTGLPTPNLYSLLKRLFFFADEVIHSHRIIFQSPRYYLQATNLLHSLQPIHCPVNSSSYMLLGSVIFLSLLYCLNWSPHCILFQSLLCSLLGLPRWQQW